MKKFILAFLCSLIPGTIMGYQKKCSAEKPLGNSVYTGMATSLRGETVNMEDFKGQVTLIVNTASKCGFTGQYSGLEELYQKYKDRGFVVLGFPSNDFGQQEPASNQEISEFCKLNYGVSFPMFEKNSVKGPNKQRVFKILTEESHEDFQGDPGWNFVKFVVDRRGFVRGRFSSMTGPGSNKISSLIEELLQKD